MLDELIHQPARLRIMSALVTLRAAAQLEFTYLREVLELTDGNLGAHLRKLEDAGYVALTKRFVKRKPRTYVAATPLGRAAFAGHVSALEKLLHGEEEPTGKPGA